MFSHDRQTGATRVTYLFVGSPHMPLSCDGVCGRRQSFAWDCSAPTVYVGSPWGRAYYKLEFINHGPNAFIRCSIITTYINQLMLYDTACTSDCQMSMGEWYLIDPILPIHMTAAVYITQDWGVDIPKSTYDPWIYQLHRDVLSTFALDCSVITSKVTESQARSCK